MRVEAEVEFEDIHLKKGYIVRFKDVVDPGDEALRMLVLEDPDGGRVRVMALVDVYIKPTHVYPVDNLVFVCGPAHAKLVIDTNCPTYPNV